MPLSNFQRLVLKNGLRLIFVPEPHSLATMAMVLVEVWSKYEPIQINGRSCLAKVLDLFSETDKMKSIK